MTPIRTPILSPDLRRQVDAELRPDEKLVWAAQPLPRLYRMQSLGAVLFGVPFTGFAIFWMATAGWATRRGPEHSFALFFPLFGLPFLLIGLGMLSSPLWMSRAARRTVYAVTDRRAIVIQGRAFGGVKVESFLPDRLTSMSRRQRADGSGDLIFEEFRQRAGSGTTTVRRGFVAVPDVRAAEDLIVATLLAGRARQV